MKSPDIWAYMAHAMVAKAKSAGLLPDLGSGKYACVDCSEIASVYDHRDYSKPLDVVPVCRRCNSLRGAAERPDGNRYQFAPYEGEPQAVADSPIAKVVRAAGGATSIADRLAIRSPTVHQWISGKRPVPPRLALRIQADFPHLASARELRPDVFGESPDTKVA